MFDKNKMKIPKELRKFDTDISKIDKNIPIIRKYNEITPDVRFKLYEYYSMKESIENVDEPHKFVFEVEEDKLKFLVEKKDRLGQYTAVYTDKLNVHVMNKFSLNRMIDGVM